MVGRAGEKVKPVAAPFTVSRLAIAAPRYIQRLAELSGGGIVRRKMGGGNWRNGRVAGSGKKDLSVI